MKERSIIRRYDDDYFFENARYHKESPSFPYVIWVGSTCLRSEDTHTLKEKYNKFIQQREATAPATQ